MIGRQGLGLGGVAARGAKVALGRGAAGQVGIGRPEAFDPRQRRLVVRLDRQDLAIGLVGVVARRGGQRQTRRLGVRSGEQPSHLAIHRIGHRFNHPVGHRIGHRVARRVGGFELGERQLGRGIAGLGGQHEPLDRLHQALVDALAVAIGVAQLVLGEGVALLGRHAIPAGGLRQVLRHRPADAVLVAERELGPLVALQRGHAVPMQGGRHVLIDAAAEMVGVGEGVLGVRVAGLGEGAQPRRLRRLDWAGLIARRPGGPGRRDRQPGARQQRRACGPGKGSNHRRLPLWRTRRRPAGRARPPRSDAASLNVLTARASQKLNDRGLPEGWPLAGRPPVADILPNPSTVPVMPAAPAPIG